MAEKISKEKQRLIKELYRKKISILDIANKAKVSYHTAWMYTRGKKYGYSSSGEYMAYLAQKKGFSSWNRQQESLVRKKGYESRNEYDKHLVLERGFESMHDYLDKKAKKRGFDSYNEYLKSLHKKGQRRQINKKFSILLKERLSIIDKSQRWLAGQLGVNSGTVSKYIFRKILPNARTQKLLFKALDLPYKSLDDLIA